MKRPRVLVIAEAANPEWVSVPLVGWSHALALREVADVHLVTQIRNRKAIVAAGLEPERDFTAIDSEAVARRLWRLGTWLRGDKGKAWTVVTALDGLAYYYFEWLVWKRFGAEIESGAIDVVHRITPLSPTTPSLLARRCQRAGVPFVLGPLNGGVPWPRGFDGARRQEREWLSYVRGLYRLLPGYRSTRRAAAALLIGSQATWEDMPARYHSKCVYVPENAIDPVRLPSDLDRAAPASSAQRGPLRVCFLGRLVPYKGPDLLIEALLPLLREGRVELELIGDGPLMGPLRERVESEGVAQAVRFRGWMDHADALRQLASAHVLGLPSIREFGGGVVLEAMAVGAVPVVVAYGGPAELVTPRTGFALRLGTRLEIVRQLTETFDRLTRARSELPVMAEAGRRRVQVHFTWSAKARQTAAVYAWVLGGTPKPDFGRPFPDTDAGAVGESSTGGLAAAARPD